MTICDTRETAQVRHLRMAGALALVVTVACGADEVGTGLVLMLHASAP